MPTQVMMPTEDSHSYVTKNTFIDEIDSDEDEQPTMMRTQTAPAASQKRKEASYKPVLDPLAEELSHTTSNPPASQVGSSSQVGSAGNAGNNRMVEVDTTPSETLIHADTETGGLVFTARADPNANADAISTLKKTISVQSNGDDSPPFTNSLMHTQSVQPGYEQTALERRDKNLDFLDEAQDQGVLEDLAAGNVGQNSLERAYSEMPPLKTEFSGSLLNKAKANLEGEDSKLKKGASVSGKLAKKVSISVDTSDELLKKTGTITPPKATLLPSAVSHASATSADYPYSKLSPTVTRIQDLNIQHRIEENIARTAVNQVENIANNFTAQATNAHGAQFQFPGGANNNQFTPQNRVDTTPTGATSNIRFTPQNNYQFSPQNAMLNSNPPMNMSPQGSPQSGPIGMGATNNMPFRDNNGNVYLPGVSLGAQPPQYGHDTLASLMGAMNAQATPLAQPQMQPLNAYGSSPYGGLPGQPPQSGTLIPLSSAHGAINLPGNSSKGSSNVDKLAVLLAEGVGYGTTEEYANMLTAQEGNTPKLEKKKSDPVFDSALNFARGHRNDEVASRSRRESGNERRVSGEDSGKHVHSYGTYENDYANDWWGGKSGQNNQKGGATSSKNTAKGAHGHYAQSVAKGGKGAKGSPNRSYYETDHHRDPHNDTTTSKDSGGQGKKSKWPNRNYQTHHVVAAPEDPNPDGTWINSNISWHEEAKDYASLKTTDREFGDNTVVVKHDYHELLSMVTESQVRSSGRHRYCIRFLENYEPTPEGIDYGCSPADGFGFVFADKLPCPKNIQRIQSIFLSKKGIVSIRRRTEVTRCKDFSIRPFESGDYIYMEIDLMNQTCAFWIEGKDSMGRTNGPPKHHRFNYGGCFPVTKRGLDRGFTSVVLKNRGTACELVKYEVFK